MSNSVVATWGIVTDSEISSVIVPDGCRDLIVSSSVGEKPRFFVSPLFDTAQTVTLSSGTTMAGFRLKPGIRVDAEKLIASLSDNKLDLNDIGERLDAFTTRIDAVEEALYSLASDVRTVTQAAKELGTSTRTLQRLVVKETSRSPMYWMMLARGRKAARALNSPLPLVDIAELYGYADQAHMSREFRRWFNISPSCLRHLPNRLNQFYNKAYDGFDTGVHNSIKNPFLSAI